MSAQLTELSAPGSYFVITASQTVYIVRISGDGDVSVTRNPIANALIGDGEPMTGVSRFTFDADTGLGSIGWWKQDPADYDYPDVPYIGTVRSTSTVLLIAELRAGDALLDAVRDAVQLAPDRPTFAAVLTALAQADTRSEETA